MVFFSKKDNGINWQKEVFETSKVLPAILKELESMGKGYIEHVEAGRIQRTEDKKENEIDVLWKQGIDLKLAEAIKCPKVEQIENNTKAIKDFTTDKELKKGKILGMNRIWIIFIGVAFAVMFVLNVLWKFRIL